MKEMYCVMEDTEYGDWSDHPFDYDAIYASKIRAIAHAKEFEYGAVHILSRTSNSWICDLQEGMNIKLHEMYIMNHYRELKKQGKI